MSKTTTFLVIAVFLAIIGAAFWMMSRGAPAVPVASSAQETGYAIMPSAQPAATAAAVATTDSQPITKDSNNNHKIMKATLHTTKGDITIEFLSEQAPNTVANFTKLAKEGFYDGVKFHRVIKNFMNQTGDPLSKDDAQMARWGTGGPGYAFADEISTTNSNAVGTVAMANSGPNTNGSQFFINTADNHFLDTKHTVFARVTAGMDVVTAINSVATGASDRPIEPVVIENVTLE